MEWDHDYRPLSAGEIVRNTDQVRDPSGLWTSAWLLAGRPALTTMRLRRTKDEVAS